MEEKPRVRIHRPDCFYDGYLGVIELSTATGQFLVTVCWTPKAPFRREDKITVYLNTNEVEPC